MKRLIYGGVRPSNNEYVFDYTYDGPSDIIKTCPPKLYKSQFGNNIYWFGYKFEDNTSSKERSKFINYIKGIDEDNTISDSELTKFIELPLKGLEDNIGLFNLDCFVYPISNRSELVTKIISVINRYTSHDLPRLNFELVKSAPKDVEFDWDSFESEYGDDLNTYTQMKKYIEDVILPKIHSQDYFSIAKSVKPKYRKYIKNYLNLDSDQSEKLKSLNGKNILIVDDINTSGATLDEILRIIKSINDSCNIFIYTLIGNL